MIPANKIEKGDIILVNGKPHCIISANKNRIEGFCYEDSAIHTIVPEHHVFMGKNFLYGKIISVFGNIGKGTGMNKMMKFMIMSQMMNGMGGGSDMGKMLPMMMLMGGNSGSIFDGMFDFEEDDEDTSLEESEDCGIYDDSYWRLGL